MFTLSTLENHSELLGQEDRSRGWKSWASREVHRRALLGHYILDGQLAYLSGQHNCAAHANNPLGLSACSRVFEAQTADEWYAALADEPKESSSFRDIYNALFSSDENDTEPDHVLRLVRAPLDARVILECLHVLVREQRTSQSSGSIISIPSLRQTRKALVRVHGLINDTWSLTQTERLELLLRWHFVCIDSLCDSIELWDQLCRNLHIKQRIFRSRRGPPNLLETKAWVREASDAKGALLHAIAVQDITSQLPLNCTQAFWMPIPVFGASVVHAIFRYNGTSSICVPSPVHWPSTLLDQTIGSQDEDDAQSTAYRKTRAFLASAAEAPNHMRGLARNLPFDTKKLQSTLHFLAVQWGVSSEMKDILSDAL